MKLQLVKFIILLSFFSYSQTPTIGLLEFDTNVSDGYTLFTPLKNNEVYLINNCGEKVNQWSFTEKPGATCYLLENGNLLRAGKSNLEIRDWDNNVIWSYPTLANGITQHHDIEPLPNGNILCVVSDTYSLADIVENGRNPAITSSNLKLDKIIELQPIGNNGASIVWEWKFKDHLIQDFNSAKLNYGVVQNHPELLNINFINNETFDYTHVNGIDYNANLDQIIISARNLSEIYIIDHSTTTSEAASHSGGVFNKGGDFLWRWGNSQVYGQGDNNNQKLFLQHDPKWVSAGYLDEGKITVFNNQNSNTAIESSIHLITPEIINLEYTKTNSIFNPQTSEWSWNGSIRGSTVMERIQSGTHSLPNGNLIICETSKGRISEITKSGTIMWSYVNPNGEQLYNQFDIITLSGNSIFRGEKYPENYIGFTGKDLTPSGLIENENSVSTACNSTLISTNNSLLSELSIINPVNDKKILFNQIIQLDQLIIFDLNGRKIVDKVNFNGNNLDINLNSGIYLLNVVKDNKVSNFKLIVK